MIEVRNLTRKFGAFTAVDDVSFSIERGEVVGFLGANGAGKTTTMRMLTGYLPPTSGVVRVAGHDVVRASLEVRRRIGYLPESVPLYREHRVEEMLAFQARLHGLPRGEIAGRIGEVLERVGLAERRRSLIGALSKGMRQRVGIAVALLPDPEVLVLDEPTSGLDPLQRVEVRALIGELAADRTVLLSSHILPEIESVAQRILVLQGGRIAADGSRQDLVRDHAGGARVRLEAFLPDPEEALRLLEALPGVGEVAHRGRLGIHHVFDIPAEEDVREDVGALAAQRGWALRELSWHEPTLEQLFARIVLGVEGQDEAPGTQGSAQAAPAAADDANANDDAAIPLTVQPGLELAPPGPDVAAPAAPPAAPPLGTPTPPRADVYNLNPFEVANRPPAAEPGEACPEDEDTPGDPATP